MAGQVDTDADAIGGARATGWFDERLDRLGVTGPFARDCLLTGVVLAVTFVLSMIFLLVIAPADGLVISPVRAWLIVAVCCAQALPLCLRRTRPLLVLALVAGLQIAIVAVAPPDVRTGGIAGIVAAYTIGTLLPARAAFLAAAAAVAVETVGAAAVLAVLVGTTEFWLPLVGHLVSSALGYFVPVVLGGYLATHRRYAELQQDQATEAVRAQQARVTAAIAAERTRMARELHDVAAHHLSGMVVQAAAVERLIDRDPAAARAGVVWLRAQGRETLKDLRLVVGVLRGGPTPPGGDTVSVPGLAMLDELVRNARDLAAPVEFVREGAQRPLSPIADVALYRMVQESLSNARQHAPGAPVRVALRFLPREITLEVVNGAADRPTEPSERIGGGAGLIGMRERAQLIGADFRAGPTSAGGWSVTVTLPTGPDGSRMP